MPLTGKVLQIFGTLPENPKIHNPDGFKYGLWIFNICTLSFGTLFLLLFKNKKKVENTFNSVENYDVIK